MRSSINYLTALVLITLGVVSSKQVALAQPLRVSENKRFLVTQDGDPFFWLADTAWELFHRTNREQARMYLLKRKSQGFNVIQAVALAELDGLNTPNAYGHRPLIENDPTRPDDRYFEHVDFVIDLADSLDMYVALLPTWGDKLAKFSWGVGPEVLNEANARAFGEWIGERYASKDNVIWVIGGDRNPREGTTDVAVWNAMADGVVSKAGGYEGTLMTYHPQPNKNGGSSIWFHEQPWLDFNMHQTGHCANQPTHELITRDYHLSPTKPVLDGEPLYEDHPNCFNAKELGYSVADDIRRIMYWNVFAGAFGQSYGCHDVWQMFTLDKEGINGPLRPWPQALDLPMANQVKHLKRLMLSRPFLTRIPDQSMVLTEQQSDDHFVIATRDEAGNFAMIYFPTGQSREIELSSLQSIAQAWWFDPRTGISLAAEPPTAPRQTFSPPSSGKGMDWVLVLDAEGMAFDRPGLSQNDSR
ncbi:MAG: glycoside hydrolase family 140 protein [Bacteroidota bacterium]